MAQTAPTTAPATAAPASWASTISLGAQLDAGITGNGDRPADGLNYGRLFDDKANTVLLNQVQLTATRPLSTSATGYDVGFILQATGGTDARYIHYLGEFNEMTNSRYQLTLLQANVLLHTPWLTSGGIDWKVGQFVTSIGYETIDPSTNPFYSHSYIFNFGPFQHTGILAEWHVNPTLDLYGQVDTGESTTFGTYSGDNNARPAGLAGFGLNNLAGGKVTWLSLVHLGPENPLRVDPQANSQMRYEADGILTYKATSKLTLTTELNYQHDSGFGADSYGASQYVSYGLTPTVTLNGRVEYYRDNAGFFVFAYPGNLDAIRSLGGYPNGSFTAGRATYSEYTLGFTYKPTVPHVALLMVRPEIRWDQTLNGRRAYNALTSTGSFTFGGDIVLGF
ncbi:outer membrane beta-barrel protein [Lichenicoccus sp.]|uniref:outer membrane beta-barrel protein n=1 Tax=Lichenicoccus sp. TaxID=2781899 RepID=UPI003D0CD6DF